MTYKFGVTMDNDILTELTEAYPEEEFLIADGFDSAIIGIESTTMRIIYSVSKCIEIIAKDCSLEDAEEYFEYNVRCAYVGEKTPIWCDDGVTIQTPML